MGSFPLLPAGLTDDEDIKVMLKGSFLWKIKSRRRKTERFYRLQEDGLTILSESCFKRARSKQICKGVSALDLGESARQETAERASTLTTAVQLW
ncbi:unnamed protein product, partial [Eretmochelys imbricata]